MSPVTAAVCCTSLLSPRLRCLLPATLSLSLSLSPSASLPSACLRRTLLPHPPPVSLSINTPASAPVVVLAEGWGWGWGWGGGGLGDGGVLPPPSALCVLPCRRAPVVTGRVRLSASVVHALSSFNLYEDAIQEPIEQFDDLSDAISDPTTQ